LATALPILWAGRSWHSAARSSARRKRPCPDAQHRPGTAEVLIAADAPSTLGRALEAPRRSSHGCGGTRLDLRVATISAIGINSMIPPTIDQCGEGIVNRTKSDGGVLLPIDSALILS
jgi:hypothetical protein